MRHAHAHANAMIWQEHLIVNNLTWITMYNINKENEKSPLSVLRCPFLSRLTGGFLNNLTRLTAMLLGTLAITIWTQRSSQSVIRTESQGSLGQARPFIITLNSARCFGYVSMATLSSVCFPLPLSLSWRPRARLSRIFLRSLSIFSLTMTTFEGWMPT